MEAGQDTGCRVSRWGVRHFGGRVVSGRMARGCVRLTPAQPASWGEVLCSVRLVVAAFSTAAIQVAAAPKLPLRQLPSPNPSLLSLTPVLAVVRCPSPRGTSSAAGGGFECAGKKLSHRD